MTNIKAHSPQANRKPSNLRTKKPDPFAGLKSSIMMVSIAGTLGGWLLLLNEETSSVPVTNASTLSTVVPNNDERALEPMPIVDISQLRQVNEVAPVEPIVVVARTRSSR